MGQQQNSVGAVGVLADLRGVVRIAKAGSIGVTGNGPRIERAEQAIAAVAELIEAAKEMADASGCDTPYIERCRRSDALRAALARVQGGAA